MNMWYLPSNIENLFSIPYRLRYDHATGLQCNQANSVFDQSSCSGRPLVIFRTNSGFIS